MSASQGLRKANPTCDDAIELAARPSENGRSDPPVLRRASTGTPSQRRTTKAAARQIAPDSGSRSDSGQSASNGVGDVESLRNAASQILDRLATPDKPDPGPGVRAGTTSRAQRRQSFIARSKVDGDRNQTVASSQIRQHYPTGQKLHGEPAVYLFEDFLREAEMEALIAAAKTNLKRGLVSGDKSDRQSSVRTGSNAWVPHDHTPAIDRLAHRLSDVVGMPLKNAEEFQIVHYAENQEYAPHLDGWMPDTERGKRYLKRGGQRIVTCLFYLNDVTEGGGTCFPELDLEVRAVRGRMLVFHNSHIGTNTPHPDSRHGGLLIERGEKWAGNLWFRERAFRSATPRSGQFTRVV